MPRKPPIAPPPSASRYAHPDGELADQIVALSLPRPHLQVWRGNPSLRWWYLDVLNGWTSDGPREHAPMGCAARHRAWASIARQMSATTTAAMTLSASIEHRARGGGAYLFALICAAIDAQLGLPVLSSPREGQPSRYREQTLREANAYPIRRNRRGMPVRPLRTLEYGLPPRAWTAFDELGGVNWLCGFFTDPGTRATYFDLPDPGRVVEHAEFEPPVMRRLTLPVAVIEAVDAWLRAGRPELPGGLVERFGPRQYIRQRQHETTNLARVLLSEHARMIQANTMGDYPLFVGPELQQLEQFADYKRWVLQSEG